jgi:YbbR domain-containing protein
MAPVFQRGQLLNVKDFLLLTTENWPAKVLSIMLAVFLFIFQRVNTMDSRTFEVPLAVTVNNNGLVATKPLPEKVRITIKTTQTELANFSESDITASIDLSKFENAGLYTAPVDAHPSLSIIDIDSIEINIYPREIKITLDKKAGKYFPVNPVYRGTAAPGYELVAQRIAPDKVWIEGPASVVNTLNSIPTEEIDITGRDSNISRIVRIGKLNPVLTTNEYNFQFNADIKSIEKISEWDSIPIVFINLPEDLIVKDNNWTGFIRLQGNERDIAAYKPEEGILYVDCSEIKSEGDYPSMSVQVKTSENYHVLKFEPETLSISVEKNETNETNETNEIIKTNETNETNEIIETNEINNAGEDG